MRDTFSGITVAVGQTFATLTRTELASANLPGADLADTKLPSCIRRPSSASISHGSSTAPLTRTVLAARSGDVVVWYKVPGVPGSAQVIGNDNLVSCETTFRSVQTTSSNQSGYCTEAAWASDNPGYNADADVPRCLERVQVAVGPVW